MTEHKRFKQLVRARMARTGERYAAARRQILGAEAEPVAKPQSPFKHFPGSVPAATALRIALANAGVRAPHTGAPFTEAMAFGIGGGIGAGVFSFHYAKEDFSSFFVAGRHLWQDDHAWFAAALEQLKLTAVVKEATGTKTAEANLAAMLAIGRPVIAWVDAGSLPYRGLPERWAGGGYHLLVVYAIDGSEAIVGDLADEPIRVPLADLTRARLRIKKFKTRLLTVEPGGKSPPLETLVRGGIRACVDGLTKAKMKNFTLDAFSTWAERLSGSKAADSWAKVFPRGKHLFTGLWSIHQYVDYYYTGGGLCRPMFAEFLAEAGAALDDAALTRASGRYAELGREWSALAETALPAGVPAFRKAGEALARLSELYHAEGAAGTEEIRACWQEIDEVGAAVGKVFPLPIAESEALLRELQGRVRSLHAQELALLGELGAWLSP
jgi:hypothetical protein